MVTGCAGSWRRAGGAARRRSFRSSKARSRCTERGISKGGEPSSPTSSRTGPSIGTMTFVASRQLSPVAAAGGVGDVVAEEAARAQSMLGETRNEVLEKSAFMNDSPSETIVPVPTVLRYGVSCLHLDTEVRPGLLHPAAGRSRCAAGSATMAELSPNRS